LEEEEKIRVSRRWKLVSAASFVLGVLTAVPRLGGGKLNLLGYSSVCPATPLSTAIMVVVAAGLYRMGMLRTKRRRRKR